MATISSHRRAGKSITMRATIGSRRLSLQPSEPVRVVRCQVAWADRGSGPVGTNTISPNQVTMRPEGGGGITYVGEVVTKTTKLFVFIRALRVRAREFLLRFRLCQLTRIFGGILGSRSVCRRRSRRLLFLGIVSAHTCRKSLAEMGFRTKIRKKV